ncbi:hypothetical protein Tco_0001867 [Tanacetum coccineum]
MTSFDYRLNPIYAIKECSSCGSLYTSNCGCSKGSLEDKILVPKPPRNCVRCARCGTPVDGPYCQGCALLRKEFMEGLFTNCVENEFFKDFQDTSESSDDNTNVVNAPREPIVVNQDPGENSSPSPPHIDHCCHECGDSLDGIFCRQCTCKVLGESFDASYNPAMITVNHPIFKSQNELLNSQNKLMEQMTTLRDLVGQAIQKKEEEKRIAEEQAAKDRSWKIPICYDMTNNTIVENLVPIPSESEGIPDSVCDVPLCNNSTPLKAFKEHSETINDSNNDYSSSDDDSYKNIDYVEASPPDNEIVSLEVVEIVISEVGGTDDDILLTIKDDILREKLLNVNLLIANIEALKDNPTSSSDVMTKSPSTSLNLFLEETNTFDNSSPESETVCFDLEENSSGSTTTRSDYSLPDYEAFYDDHIEEKSSGSTTTHADFSQYDPFIFDLSINPFPPVDMSDFYHEEFADELAHIISLPEYDHFCFKIKPEMCNLTMDVVGDIFPTREPRIHVPNILPTHPTLDLYCMDLSSFSHVSSCSTISSLLRE